MGTIKILTNSPNVCFRMLIAVKSDYSHEVTKIEASHGVLLVDDTFLTRS